MTKKNKCHPELPHFARQMCESCYQKEYRSLNKAVAKENGRLWREKNRDYDNAKKKQWALSNPEKIKETKRAYVGRNLLQYRAMCAKRLAAKLQRTPKWANLKAIKQFYMNCPENMEVDHIVPMRGENVSGLHVLENLQYLTKEQNCSKGNKLLFRS